ncbi:MAG: tRNA guanosine(34) transglycosylase Tgt [Candidatus Methylomirabilales bacterium]
MTFELLTVDASGARRGRLHTPHGTVETPVFLPCATVASVKTLSPRELTEVGVQVVLCNTYHLMLRPGAEVVAQLGGLHRFIGWPGPILTDSGGYQIFSLAPLGRVTDEGVLFRSHIDGSRLFLSPEQAVAIQEALGADIIMPLDECLPYPVQYEAARCSLERTLRWAARSREVVKAQGVGLFGIVQGGMFADLRSRAVERLTALEFDGYAVGGLSVGEPKAEMARVLTATAPLLPKDRPRYLMGVGTPGDLLRGIEVGMDIFDCVIPTRHGRRGELFTSAGRLSIKAARYAADARPVDPECACYTCRHFSRAYLRHLFLAREMLGLRLNTLHNLYFYCNLVDRARRAILEGSYRVFAAAQLRRIETPVTTVDA